MFGGLDQQRVQVTRGNRLQDLDVLTMGLVKVVDGGGVDGHEGFDLVPHPADEFEQMRTTRAVVEAAVEVLIDAVMAPAVGPKFRHGDELVWRLSEKMTRV